MLRVWVQTLDCTTSNSVLSIDHRCEHLDTSELSLTVADALVEDQDVKDDARAVDVRDVADAVDEELGCRVVRARLRRGHAPAGVSAAADRQDDSVVGVRHRRRDAEDRAVGRGARLCDRAYVRAQDGSRVEGRRAVDRYGVAAGAAQRDGPS